MPQSTGLETAVATLAREGVSAARLNAEVQMKQDRSVAPTQGAADFSRSASPADRPTMADARPSYSLKLLLDENLSPAIAVALCADGIDAAHVRDRGLIAATDAEVLAHAYNEDRILVTANVDDFVKLARARELHPGIILVEDGALLRHEQAQVVHAALAAIQAEQGAGRDMVNRLLHIHLAGTKRFETVPPDR